MTEIQDKFTLYMVYVCTSAPACVCACVCVMPSGKERFHHNVTTAAAETEVNTQGRGHRGGCVRVKGTTAAAPSDTQSRGEWLSHRERS